MSGIEDQGRRIGLKERAGNVLIIKDALRSGTPIPPERAALFERHQSAIDAIRHAGTPTPPDLQEQLAGIVSEGVSQYGLPFGDLSRLYAAAHAESVVTQSVH